MRSPPWAKEIRNTEPRDTDERVSEVVALPTKSASKKVKDSMARYAIPSDKAFGVSVGDPQKNGEVPRPKSRSCSSAEGLWKTVHYEARMLACFRR